MISFQLLNKTTKVPTLMSDVDIKVCELMGVEVHPRHYGDGIYNWFDTIGFQLASGKTLEDGENSVRNYYANSSLWADEFHWIDKVICLLQANYTSVCF